MKTRLAGGLAEWFLLGAAVLGGCGGGGWPEVVDTRSLRAGGTPKIERIRDLGTKAPPELGPMTGESDGVASPGELLLVEGGGFGKQPTVAIDKRASEVVARTAGGGIVVRVPGAVGTGPRDVEVTVGDAHTSARFPLRRLAVALHGETLFTFAVDAAGSVAVGKPIEVAGARAVGLSPDGACAYVVGGGKLRVIDLGAPGGPSVVRALDIGVDAWGLVVAERAPVLFAVADGEVQAFEIKIPRQPARYEKAALPAETKGARKVDIDPDGHRLALLIPEGNRLAIVDVSTPTATRLLAVTPLLPEVRVPFAVDLRFESDGETVWALAGDNSASMAIGTQPTRVTAVRLEGDASAPTVSVLRTSVLTDAWAPRSLLVSRAPPPIAGTTIHLAPESAKIFFSAAARELWSAGSPAAVAARLGKTPQASLERATLGGEGGRVVATDYLLGPLDLAGVDFAVAAALSPTAHDFGIATLATDRAAPPTFLRLAPASDADLTPPFVAADIRVQP